MNRFQVEFDEDGTATLLGRITASNGSGGATGVSGEGYWLLAADVSAIERQVFDLGVSTTVAQHTDSLVVADTVIIPAGTDNVLWTLDAVGYNFLDTIPATYFPTGDNKYEVEYKVTLAGGEIFHAVYGGQAKPIRGS